MTAAGPDLTIRDFVAGDEIAFRNLNEEWIRRYFAMEPKDEESLADPRETILSHGGRIFFAVRRGVTVGCCALLAMGPGEYEVAKMAVTESVRGAGVGRRLLETVIAEARAAGARRLYLETNQKWRLPFTCMNRSDSGIFRGSAWSRLHTRVPTWPWSFNWRSRPMRRAEIFLAQDSAVMQLVTGDDIGDGAHGNRIIAGDAAPHPSFAAQ